MNLTCAVNLFDTIRTAPHWAVEVDSSVIQARKICVDRHMSFFMRSALWWGGVFGGFGLPVPEPGLSTITPRHRPKFDSFGRWFKTIVQESIMTNNTQVAPSVRVNETNIPVIEHNGIRVITADLMAQVYGTAVTNIHDNFRNNPDRFEEGKHFFKLEGESLRNFKKSLTGIFPVSRQTRNLTLWTERGAARHAKMLDTDQAWDVFDKLESAYFEPTKLLPTQEPAKLPSTDDLPPDVLAAIDHRAMAMSIRHYDKYKQELREAIKKWAQHLTGQMLVEFVKTIEMKDSQLVIVHSDTLWRLSTRLSTLEVVQREALDAVHTLEQETGRSWYGR